MKKIVLVIFCALAMSVIAFAGTVAAPNYDIEHYLYQGEMEPTVDGTYSPNGEWDPSGTQTFGTDGIFRDYWAIGPVNSWLHFTLPKIMLNGIIGRRSCSNKC